MKIRDGLIAEGCADSCFPFEILANYRSGHWAGGPSNQSLRTTESRPGVEIDERVRRATLGAPDSWSARSQGYSAYRLTAYPAVDRPALRRAGGPAHR